jgi:hypothetical protein
MRTAFKRLFLAGVLAGVAYAVWRAVRSRIPAPATDATAWESAPFPFPPVPRPPVTGTDAPPAPPPATEPWVEADNGTCPTSHPVKGKLSSGIFHVPGGQNYGRTHADRCYVDERAAEADGLRRSQR